MPSRRFLIRASYILVLLASTAVVVALVFLLQSKSTIFATSSQPTVPTETIEPFPVSVNSFTETIREDPEVNSFFTESLAGDPGSASNWWNQVAAVLVTKDWYQNLASPVSRIIVIWPGERKEEAVNNIAAILRWNNTQQAEFESLVDSSAPVMLDGKYFPGQYVTHRHATPEDVHGLIYQKFSDEILSRYTEEVEAAVPLNEALIIASLLEREASDFENMREVSGVIWNRLFIDMPLQLDATLQYVRGSETYEPKWWPVPRPRDKFLDSPFNTYQNEGLPPAPIANPSTEAILAALNPVVTDCLYYFHTNNGGYYCSATYEGHVSKLKELYGRGS